MHVLCDYLEPLGVRGTWMLSLFTRFTQYALLVHLSTLHNPPIIGLFTRSPRRPSTVG